MSVNPPCEEIADLEQEKTYQYSQESRDRIEDKIINLIDNYLMSSSAQYRAASAEYERLSDLIDANIKIVEYTKALNNALKETRGAAGAHLGDFLIPGEIGTIGSSLQTRIASESQQNATSIFSGIPAKSECKVIGVGNTQMTDVLEGIDIVFDALRRSGELDLTSLVNSANHALKAGDIEKAIKVSWSIVEKMNAPELGRKFKEMESLIKNSINDVRQRCIMR